MKKLAILNRKLHSNKGILSLMTSGFAALLLQVKIFEYVLSYLAMNWNVFISIAWLQMLN